MSVRINDGGFDYKISSDNTQLIIGKCSAAGAYPANPNYLLLSDQATAPFSGYKASVGINLFCNNGTAPGIMLSNGSTGVTGAILAGTVGLGFQGNRFIFDCPNPASNTGLFQVSTSVAFDGAAASQAGNVLFTTGTFNINASTVQWGGSTLVKATQSLDATFPATTFGTLSYRCLTLNHTSHVGIKFTANTYTGGIGLTSTSGVLNLTGQAVYMIIASPSGTAQIHRIVSGTTYTVGTITTTAGNLSDISLKTNIQPYQNCLDKIINLQPISFTWLDEKNATPGKLGEVGFVAQDVIDIVPEIVVKGPDNILSVRYDQLTAVLAGAVKELNDKLSKQTSLIAELTNKLSSLESI